MVHRRVERSVEEGMERWDERRERKKTGRIEQGGSATLIFSSLLQQCMRKYGNASVWKIFTDLFDYLPVCWT
eukprot:764327-Hanusia_phi.AAC.1